MPLEGIRAWIGEVERKLGMRTRVFLVLAALAIGGAGAAMYLTLDTRDAAVSENDVRTLQEDLEARIAGGATPAGTSLSELEADLRALEAKVTALESDGAGAGPGGAESGATGAGTGGAPSPGPSGDLPDASTGASGGGIATDSDGAAKERLRKLLDEAKARNEATAEGETNVR
jgi:hypothetical protein